MSKAETLFVVVDPTQDDHIALQRAIITAGLRDTVPKLKVFIGVDRDATDMSADNLSLYRDSDWFETLRQPLDAAGLDFTIVVCWADAWHDAILQAAKRTEADLILVPDYSAKNHRSRLTDAKWQLLRHSKCPVMLVRPGSRKKREVILGAVKMQETRVEYTRLNDLIVDRGKWMAEAYGADFHVVNAYSDSMNYPDRGNMTRKVGIEAERFHVKQGAPEEAIRQVAEEIDADVVILGVLPRRGGLLAIRGNVSERIMGALSDSDVMTFS